MQRINLDLLDYTDDYQRVFQGKPFTGIGYTYEDSETGNITYEVTLIEGIEDGPWRGWYPTGELEYTGTRKYGVEHGEYKKYFRNGRLNIDAEYESGLLINRKVYNEGGSLVEYYEGNADRTGKRINYYSDGTLKTEEVLVKGKIISKKTWNENGNLVE